MMVGISPVRNSPIIRRRKRHTTLTATAAVHPSSSWSYRWGVIACVALVLICLRQTYSKRTTTTITDARYYEAYPAVPPQNHLRAASPHPQLFDAIVVGSGLAGLTTALQTLDRGGRVALIEKETTLGGNSLKASSGMNAPTQPDDSLPAFAQDTTNSASTLARPDLIQALVESSVAALNWLQDRVGVDLSQVAQLGGHSYARTHRPSVGMVGAELIVHLEQLIRTYDEEQVTIMTGHQVTQLIQQRGKVAGVQVLHTHTNRTITLGAPQVVLATGGFASDRRSTSLLRQVRPDLVSFGTTGGQFSTGDGIALATRVGAQTTDLKEIQLHPTGFVGGEDDPTKTLAAELLRGVGGLLLHPNGSRFCNELGTRDYVTQQMLKTKAQDNAFALVLTEQAAAHAQKHVELYSRKGLLTRVKGLPALAKQMKGGVTVSADQLYETFQNYQTAMENGQDEYGKTVFKGFPTSANNNWQEQVFFVGMVTPVLHYCMGGLSVDVEGHVLNQRGSIIPGLFAAGEVAGGVHGKNRLGGNSLLECTVFGRKIGNQLVLRHGRDNVNSIPDRHLPSAVEAAASQTPTSETIISLKELKQHNTPEDLWMTLKGGMVYNLTAFARHHPGGAAILETLAGTDATEAFETVHSPALLQPFHSQPGVIMGKLDPAALTVAKNTQRAIARSELQQHANPEDCWVAFHGQVFDMTEFSKIHKGGAYLIQKYAGKDATDTYKVFHKKDKMGLVAKYRVGMLMEEDAASV